ncbi:MAG: mannitol dehydrogenase family protein [Bradyrhizobium sp.]|uniref:mannitol dehydrogenase family protein n=1 Tax=Bradyrhizobium sp. TaxID=376 RepID=UPI001214668C|nr:mannitol dehydrogenase family protein [Bradyrhizobium sp.]THD57692.1 MAG: mannitol dehydrogenase family protein [Bradyrhizobium sp.]
MSPRQRLSAASLSALPANVARPAYDRSAIATGIVHLGIGSFHRAHQAVYTDSVLTSGDRRWGIVGASLRSPDTRDILNAQDYFYTLNLRAEAEALRVIGSLQDILVAPENPAVLIETLCRPSVAVVSLTVTEKGYHYDPATRALNEGGPNIRHDLAHPGAPRTIFGFLAAAIARRRKLGVMPFTVLSCDNLPANGRTLHGLLSRYAQLVSPDLGSFVRDEILCPNTMVDRIVPATTDDDRRRLGDALGVDDLWPVVAEPFTQWVIEDRFSSGRPAWDEAGATFVRDVAPFESMKLRLLNGSHSALAYLGYLSGYETVAEAMGDDALAGFAEGLMTDAMPTLDLTSNVDVGAYKASLLARFRNRALHHRTWQIAMDGSQKLPQRILEPIRDRLAKGLPIERHALVVAGWMRYVTGVDERGRLIDVRDPLLQSIRDTLENAGRDVPRIVGALLGLKTIFGGDLPADQRFRLAVSDALTSICSVGSRQTIERLAKF